MNIHEKDLMLIELAKQLRQLKFDIEKLKNTNAPDGFFVVVFKNPKSDFYFAVLADVLLNKNRMKINGLNILPLITYHMAQWMNNHRASEYIRNNPYFIYNGDSFNAEKLKLSDYKNMILERMERILNAWSVYYNDMQE